MPTPATHVPHQSAPKCVGRARHVERRQAEPPREQRHRLGEALGEAHEVHAPQQAQGVTARTRHFESWQHFVRDAYKNLVLTVHLVDTHSMIADILTKAMPKVLDYYKKFRDIMISSWTWSTDQRADCPLHLATAATPLLSDTWRHLNWEVPSAGLRMGARQKL